MIAAVLMLLVSLEGQTPQHRRFMQPSLPSRKCYSCACSNSTNYALWSQDFSNAAWVKGGAAGAPTVTASDGSSVFRAPDGSNNAQRISFLACPTSQSFILQGPLTTAAGSLTSSLWIRGSGSISIGIFDNTAVTGHVAVFTATSDWVLVSDSLISTGTSNYFVFGCNANSVYTGYADTGAATIYVWQGQIEPASATCPILTTTAAASRTGACAAVCQ